jgi:hypothetical protein
MASLTIPLGGIGTTGRLQPSVSKARAAVLGRDIAA